MARSVSVLTSLTIAETLGPSEIQVSMDHESWEVPDNVNQRFTKRSLSLWRFWGTRQGWPMQHQTKGKSIIPFSPCLLTKVVSVQGVSTKRRTMTKAEFPPGFRTRCSLAPLPLLLLLHGNTNTTARWALLCTCFFKCGYCGFLESMFLGSNASILSSQSEHSNLVSLYGTPCDSVMSNDQ